MQTRDRLIEMIGRLEYNQPCFLSAGLLLDSVEQLEEDYEVHYTAEGTRLVCKGCSKEYIAQNSVAILLRHSENCHATYAVKQG